MPALKTGMPQTANVLSLMFQDKMRRSQPANVMAQKELEYMEENPNYLKDRFEMKSKKEKLQFEKDLLDWGVKSLSYIDYNEYPQFRQTALSYGFNPAILPESFENEEAFEKFRVKAAIGAPEYKKMMEGNAFTISKLNDNGTISEIKVKSREEAKPYIEQGYQIGTLKGTSTKPQYEHKPVYNEKGQITGYKSIEKGKDFTYEAGNFGNKPESAKPAWEHVTVYGPDGKTERIAIEKGQKYVPPEGWSLDAPPSTSPEQKKLEDIKKNFFTAVNRANQAKMRVGQFVPDENSEGIAEQEYNRAAQMVQEYLAAGGQPEDLGLKPLTAQEARKILDETGGDANQARALARQRGYIF